MLTGREEEEEKEVFSPFSVTPIRRVSGTNLYFKSCLFILFSDLRSLLADDDSFTLANYSIFIFSVVGIFVNILLQTVSSTCELF